MEKIKWLEKVANEDIFELVGEMRTLINVLIGHPKKKFLSS